MTLSAEKMKEKKRALGFVILSKGFVFAWIYTSIDVGLPHCSFWSAYGLWWLQALMWPSVHIVQNYKDYLNE
jgi:hypothetical protein